MTKREINLRIFEHKPIPQVLFQPRIESWYAWHKQFNILPEKYQNIELRELFNQLDISMRYISYYTGIPEPIEVTYSAQVKIIEHFNSNLGTKIIQTPYGELTEKYRMTIDKTWRTVEFAVKSPDDLRKLRWLYENTSFHFNPEKFEEGNRYIGELGVPQFYIPKSPYQALCQQWMALETLIYALADIPEKVEQVMNVIDTAYDPMYEDIIACPAVKILNFGENLHAQLISPAYFEKYLIPFYQKRCRQLGQAGIFTHIHIDGFFKPILKYLKYLPFDGYEALTPEPQGDVSLEEIKEYIGDKILLDGIPAIYFLPHYQMEELEDCVKRIIQLFHPRLVLGISDELPEGADESALDRVKWIAKLCREQARDVM
ncbi:MAG: hypothetical protein N3A72_07690 [bacterium]|nr:hypothetical protein [bacterium]